MDVNLIILCGVAAFIVLLAVLHRRYRDRTGGSGRGSGSDGGSYNYGASGIGTYTADGSYGNCDASGGDAGGGDCGGGSDGGGGGD